MVFDGQVSAEPFADEIAGAVGRNEIAFVGEILDVQRHAVVVDHIAPAGFLDDEVFASRYVARTLPRTIGQLPRNHATK